MAHYNPSLLVFTRREINPAVSTGNPENYVGFLNLFVIKETGKELNYPKGGKGL